MTKEEFNRKYMHHYPLESIEFEVCEDEMLVTAVSYEIDGVTTDFQPYREDGSVWCGYNDITMHLRSLEDMTADECIILAQMGEIREVHGVDMDTLKGGFLYKTHSSKATWLSFDEISADQFLYLLGRGYNLFDPKWEHTIKITI